jgi:transcription antitermination factor NusA-like protein
MLCRACNEKVKEGLISDTVVRVSRILLKLSEDIKSLKDIAVKKAVESDGLIVVVCGKGDAAKVIGKSGLTVKKLERELGKPVKIVEEAGSVKEFLAGLLHPVPIVGVNVLYKQKDEVLRVLVGKSIGRHIKISDLREIVKKVFGKDVEIIHA